MHANLIGGAWTDGVRTYQNTNPSDTRDVIGDYAVASREQALEAVAAAHAAFPAWSLSTPQQRFDILDAVGNEIIARISEAYLKIRNTCRFMLGNLGDYAEFDPSDSPLAGIALLIGIWALLTQGSSTFPTPLATWNSRLTVMHDSSQGPTSRPALPCWHAPARTGSTRWHRPP